MQSSSPTSVHPFSRCPHFPSPPFLKNTHSPSLFYPYLPFFFISSFVSADSATQDPEMASITQRGQDYQQYQHRPTKKVTPSSSKVLALATLVPLGAFLLLLSGVILTGTVIGLAVTAPLFVIFSPVLLPAVIVIGLAVTGFLTSGAFGVTALSSFAWLANYIRRSRWPEQLEHAKRRAAETMGHVAKRTKEAGEAVLSRAQEPGQTVQNEAQDTGPNLQTKAREGGTAREEVKAS